MELGPREFKEGCNLVWNDYVVHIGELHLAMQLKLPNSLTLFRGGGQKRLRAPSSLNFDKNNHRMRL